MSQDNSGPPMVTWLLTMLLFAGLAAGFRWCANSFEPPPSEAFVSYNLERLTRFRDDTRDDKPKIVLLGNSTLRYATELDHDGWGFPESDSARVFRLCNNWARFIDIAPLADEILSLRPNVIVIQPELLGRTQLRGVRPPVEELQTYVSWRLFGLGEWDPMNQDQAEVQFDQGNYNDQSDRRFAERVKKITEWQGIDLDSESARAGRSFLRMAKTQGCRVVLLWSPTTERVRPLIDEVRQQLQPIVEEYADAGSNLLEYPHQLENTDFTDFVHMNQSGRTKFMNWFVPEVMALTRD